MGRDDRNSAERHSPASTGLRALSSPPTRSTAATLAQRTIVRRFSPNGFRGDLGPGDFSSSSGFTVIECRTPPRRSSGLTSLQGDHQLVVAVELSFEVGHPLEDR